MALNHATKNISKGNFSKVHMLLSSGLVLHIATECELNISFGSASTLVVHVNMSKNGIEFDN